MPVSKFRKGFNQGVEIRDVRVEVTPPSKVFYVGNGTPTNDAVTGSDSNDGTRSRPFSTLDYAIGRCTASAGDVIYVLPGHAETVNAAAFVALDVAGVKVIGLGDGRNRPTFTYATSTAATITISGANASIENCVFAATGIDSLVSMIVVSGADVRIAQNEFIMGDSGEQALLGILTTVGAMRMVVEGNIFRSTDVGANSAIKLVGATDGVIIRENQIYGDFGDAAVHNPTGNVVTNLTIEGNVLQNVQTGDHALELVSACTGWVRNNFFITDTVTVVATPGSTYLDGNRWINSGRTGEASTPWPFTVTAGGQGFGAQSQIAVYTKADIASGAPTWTTGNSPITVFTVTGDVLMRVWGTGTVLTSTSDTGTLSVGVSGLTTLFLGTTTVNTTNFPAATTVVWIDTSATAVAEAMVANNLVWTTVAGGQDVIVTVATNSMTAGAINLYCEWIPLSAGASVVAVAAT